MYQPAIANSDSAGNNPSYQGNTNSLTSFIGGFISSPNFKTTGIKYYARSQDFFIGFGISSVSFLVNNSVHSSSFSYTSVSVSFSNSNSVIPVAEDPSHAYLTSFTKDNTSVVRSIHQFFSKILFKNLYNHIDLEYEIVNGSLKYNFYVYPGGNPDVIKMHWTGPLTIIHNSTGILVNIHTAASNSNIFDSNPIGFQNDSFSTLNVNFFLSRSNTVSFTLSSYDHNQLLIIDPSIAFSTYIGGSGTDIASDVFVDAAGNIYFTGYTNSFDFPIINSYTSTAPNIPYVYVCKLASNGTTLLFSSIIGPGSAAAVKVDSLGNIIVTGYTTSPNFPTINAFNSTFSGVSDVFAFKLSSNGSSLLYSTYIGGSGHDAATYLSLDTQGNAFITGVTYSSDFPTVNAFNSTYGGFGDAFVLKLASNGSTLLYSTFIGGSNFDYGTRLVANATDNVFVSGYTTSIDFPIKNAYQSNFSGSEDGFIFELSANGSTLLYSTFIGGNSQTFLTGIALDSNQSIFAVGYSDSFNFNFTEVILPVQNGLFHPFVLKFSPNGTLVYSTLDGGTSNDYSTCIAVNSQDNAIITGYTSSSDFPLLNPNQPTYGGGEYDAFISVLNQNGSNPVYSTFLGGSSVDSGGCLALDHNNNIYVTGYTQSSNFPTVNAHDSSYSGSTDIFVTKINAQNLTSFSPTFPTQPATISTTSIQFSLSSSASTNNSMNLGSGILTNQIVQIGILIVLFLVLSGLVAGFLNIQQSTKHRSRGNSKEKLNTGNLNKSLSKLRTCRNCGSTLFQEDLFCQNCGHKQ